MDPGQLKKGDLLFFKWIDESTIWEVKLLEDAQYGSSNFRLQTLFQFLTTVDDITTSSIHADSWDVIWQRLEESPWN